MKPTISFFIILLLTSCSSTLRNELTLNCACSLTEYFVASTDSEDNNTKEFSFINSPLFDLDVPKEDFATSCAVLINLDSEIDSSSLIKINIIKDKKGRKKTVSYRYDIYELGKITPIYAEIRMIINAFVENVYKDQFQECYKYLGFEIESKEYQNMLNQFRAGLNDEYINTRVIAFDKKNEGYNIHGTVLTAVSHLKLFTMRFEKTNEGLKIVRFKF